MHEKKQNIHQQLVMNTGSRSLPRRQTDMTSQETDKQMISQDQQPNSTLNTVKTSSPFIGSSFHPKCSESVQLTTTQFTVSYLLLYAACNNKELDLVVNFQFHLHED